MSAFSIERLMLNQERVFSGLANRQSALERYARTIAELHQTNVVRDADYQRSFNALYGVRRNAKWREVYFQILQDRKERTGQTFSSIIEAILDATGRVEASFASKLLATIDPSRAVYDSIVRKNLGLPTRPVGTPNRIEALCRDYEVIQDHLAKMVECEGYRPLRERFDASFPQFRHFTDIKVLDLMIWQMR